MKHTRGPWEVCNFDKSVSCTIDSIDGVVVAEPMGPEGPWGSVKEEHEANARLIAAAPELLEALKGLRATIRYETANNDQQLALDKACQAIAKAEGQPSV